VAQLSVLFPTLTSLRPQLSVRDLGQVLFRRSQVVEAEVQWYLGVVVVRKTLVEAEERTSLMEEVVEEPFQSLSAIYVDGHEDLCIHLP
jgi:hypothetical protein